ncbi:MAG: c-type cytochrome, partial [Planctomycetes bacterium]|nr:c-type cytochrome [Planctomycetota bacterium]
MPGQGEWKCRRARHGLAAGLLLALVTSVPTRADEGAIAVEDLRPGLVTEYRDEGRPPVTVVRLEPTIALALNRGEAPHPRLQGDGGSAHWEGYLNVLRAGNYRFQARVRGRFRLLVAGKPVLEVAAQEKEPMDQEGPETRLEAGVHRLQAEFIRLPGSARLEVLWQAPFFHQEPLPFDHLGHLPAQVPASLDAHQRQEHGRFLVEEYGCLRCHRPAAGDRLAQVLLSRQGPDLSQAGRRLSAAWIYHWLESPPTMQPGAVMPCLFRADETGRVERYAVAQYLASLGGPLKPDKHPLQGDELKTAQEHGRQLFTSTGCMACHREKGDARKEKPSPAAWETERLRLFPLKGLGSQTTPEKLADYLNNPLTVDPSGRMPSMVLRGHEARDLAYFLCASRDAAVDATEEDDWADFQDLAPDDQLLPLGKHLVSSKGCTNCHTITPGGQALPSIPAAAAFEDLKKASAQSRGCLADQPSSGEGHSSPLFAWRPGDRDSLRLFLREGVRGAGSPAPAYAAGVALERFNCLACHQRDGA